MERSEVEAVFQEALLQPAGQRSVVVFQTEKAVNSARVQLYNEKRKYLAANSCDQEELVITKKVENGKYFLILTKAPRGFTFFQEDENGKLVQKELRKTHLEECKTEKEKETPETLLRQLYLENRPSWAVDSLFDSAFPGVNWRELACSLNLLIREE